MSTFQVTAPYATLRVPDTISGGWTLRGFYVGAPLPADVHAEDLARHLRKGMVQELGGAEPEAAAEEEAKPAKAAKAAKSAAPAEAGS